MGVERPEFSDPIRQRIYEYVERSGAVDRGTVRTNVRVPDGSASKPARSGTVEQARLDPATFSEHVDALLADGHLVERDGKLRVPVTGDAVRTVDTERGPMTIRPGRQEDLPGVVSLIRSVVAEGTHVVAETVAEALDRENALSRHNDARSRLFFVATVPEDADADADTAGTPTDDAGTGTDGTGETVVGWLHLHSPGMEKLRHTAEVTVGVRDDYGRFGIGSRLLDRGVEWAADRGYVKLYQSVPATNEAAVPFLEANGWSVEATREDHYLVDGEFVDEVMLAYDLRDGD
ncbi:GNAT family N-acetyltransferase [Halobacteriales archaeon QS_1_68_17]|nr:MAG: GNAT family N-acetyltransferase [Halobacteriales archaeon QS_1_68_17]